MLVRFVFIYFYLFYHSYGQTIRCPTIAAIFPPSGSPTVAFRANGTFLEEVASYRVVQRGLNFGEEQIVVTSNGSLEILPVSLQFLLSLSPRPRSGNVDIVFTPKARQNCSIQRSAIAFRPYDPSVSDIVPSSGQAGTLIRLGVGSFPPFDGDNSSNFTITMGGSVASYFLQGTRIIVIRAPQLELSSGETSRSVAIEIITQYGTKFSLGDWGYLPPGRITSVSPRTGQNGTRVTLSGVNLLGNHGNEEVVSYSLASVYFNGYPVTVTDYTDSQINVIARSAPPSGPGDILLTTTQTMSDHISSISGEGPSTEMNSSWMQAADGVINSVIPRFSQMYSMVYMCGHRLLGGGTHVSAVRFGETESANFSSLPVSPQWVTSDNSTECLLTRVPNVTASEEIPLDIVSNTGAYVPARIGVSFGVAKIESFEPTFGQYGTVVNITGRHLDLGTTNVSSVNFGTINGVIVSYDAIGYNWIAVSVGEGVVLPDNATNVTLDVTVTSSQLGRDFKLQSSPLLWEHRASGRITYVSPSFGQTGTIIHIRGNHLLGHGGSVVEAYIGGVRTEIISDSDTTVLVYIPAIQVGMAGLKLVADTGAIVESGPLLEIREAGRVTAVHPLFGQVGTRVTITGKHLYGHGMNITNVTVAGIPATIDHEASNSSVVQVRAGPTHDRDSMEGEIVITTSSGVIIRSNTLNWTYVVEGHIEGLSPDEGEKGTVVRISGYNLLGGGMVAESVYLNGVPVVRIAHSNDSLVVVENGDLRLTDPSKPQSVYIESDTGAVTVGGYFVQRERGVITRISPTRGVEGTYVTLTGQQIVENGSSIVSVTLAGVPVMGGSVSVLNDSAVVVRAGHGESGVSGGMRVILDTGSTVHSRTQSNFTYDIRGEIEGISPNYGTEGDVIRISGQRLVVDGVQGPDVYLSGSRVSRVLSASPSEVLVVAGPTPVNTSGEVKVISSNGAVVRGQIFTFSENVTFSIISGGPVGQYGTELLLLLPFEPDPDTRAFVGGIEAGIHLFNHRNRTLLITVPRSSQVGARAVDVTVRDRDGRILRVRNAFNYTEEEGHISTVTPASGQFGTEVVISGRHLLGGSGGLRVARLAGVPAAVTSANETVVVLRAGASSVSVCGDVELMGETGAITVLTVSWCYVTPGVIRTVSPLIGQFGTMVDVEGVSLLGGGTAAARVFLNQVEVMKVVSSSDSRVTVRAGSPSTTNQSALATEYVRIVSNTGNIVVTTNHSLSFRYSDEGSIDTVHPPNGTGGTIVRIQGEGLLGGGVTILRVRLADVEAIKVLNTSNSEVTVMAGFTQNGLSTRGNVQLESNTGALVVLDNGWQYTEECPPGKFKNTTSETCENCHHLCRHCSNHGNTQCYECTGTAFTIRQDVFVQCVEECPLSTADRVCVDDCEVYQYWERSELFNKTSHVCRNCSSKCDPSYGCGGPSDRDCELCASVSLYGVCVDECPTGFYPNVNKTCVRCNEQCDPLQGCRGPLTTDCALCKNLTMEVWSSSGTVATQCVESCPMDFYRSRSACLPCHEYCSNGCNGPTLSDCHQCKFAAFRYQNGSTLCTASCATPSNHTPYYRDLEGVCQQCHWMCSVLYGCSGPSASECTRCVEGALMLNKECVVVCPVGYYNQSGLCSRCDPVCTTQGCEGPGPNSCFVIQTNAFEAGSGTTALVVLVIVALVFAVVILSVILVHRCRKQKHNYNVRAQLSKAFRPVKRTFSGSNHIKRKESIKISLSRTNSVLRREGLIEPGDPEFINPLVQDDILNHSQRFTGGRFVVNVRTHFDEDRDCFDSLSNMSDVDKESNQYQEIPIIEANVTSPLHRDPERVTIGSEKDEDIQTSPQVEAGGEKNEEFTVKIVFESDHDEGETEYASPKPHPPPTSENGGDLTLEETYCNMQSDVSACAMKKDKGLYQYDTPRRVRQRTLSTGFLDSHYDTPQTQKTAISTYDTPTAAKKAVSIGTHPYATPTRPLRRKSVSGAMISRVHATPPPQPRASSPEDHVYATVKRLEGSSEKESQYERPKKPSKESTWKGSKDTPSSGRKDTPSSGRKDTPSSGRKDTPSNVRKTSAPQESPASSGFKKFFSLSSVTRGKQEARPYEIPHSGPSAGPPPPLPPIPIETTRVDGTEEDDHSSPVERIYEETFAGFDSDFSSFTFGQLEDTPPALPERRISRTTTMPSRESLTQEAENVPNLLSTTSPDVTDHQEDETKL